MVFKNYINGEWVTGETFENRNPANIDELVGEHVSGTPADAEAKGEVRRTINILRYFAGEGARLNGIMVPSERDRVQMWAFRRPIGVVGLITPWNFPSAIPAWKLAPALICGNTVVMKPASAAPLSAWRIVEALHQAGIPKGVVNFVSGSGGELGQALVSAKALKAISFTGS